jgi:matrixin
MTYRTHAWFGCALVAGIACSLAQAQFLDATVSTEDGCTDAFTAQLTDQLERQLFSMLPQDQQAIILSSSPADLCDRLPDGAEPTDVTYDHVAGYISREGFEGMPVGRRFMLASVIRNTIDGKQSAPFCFEPGSVTDEEAWAFSLALFGDNARYQQTSRWSSTALSGGGLSQGDPTTITYSFPPDGTNIPNLGIGLGSGPNALHAWLNGIYGNEATWMALFDQIFESWSDQTGLTYVREFNDDGLQMNGAAGVAGVRGDVRIGAFNFQNDGNGGVLAYNNFPQDGDMVFDAFDSFYNNTGSNSRRFRNVAAHEHGHGLGMLHVCPANATKLMEPFVSTSYDGPQTDDILNGNRHYGDSNESNDTAATATNVGDPGFGLTLSNVSIDDNSDVDYYAIDVVSPRQIIVTVIPRGGEYEQGSQTGSCNSGPLTNYNIIHDLSIEIIDSDGVTVLDAANDTGSGGSELASAVAIDPGTYYVRVDGDNTNSTQLYDIGFTLISPDPIVIENIDPAPPLIAPGAIANFDLRITEISQTLTTANLRYRVDGGTFQSVPLTSQGGDVYTATLPAFVCADAPEFYIEAFGSGGFTQLHPEDGPAGPFTSIVGAEAIVINDNAETDIGWAVTGSASDGQWDRGVPVGGGDRGDPAIDADGSGAAWLTDNVDGNSDIDNGTTTMTSPALDASHPESIVEYWTWLSNNTGAAAGEDPITVEISNNNGATWTTLEVIGPDGPQAGGGWFFSSFRIADFITPTAQFKIRFTAEDSGAGSIVEAGVDGVTIKAFGCDDTACVADFNTDGVVDFFDVQAFLAAFAANDPSADLTNDGTFDFFDVQAFLNAFAAGCP